MAVAGHLIQWHSSLPIQYSQRQTQNRPKPKYHATQRIQLAYNLELSFPHSGADWRKACTEQVYNLAHIKNAPFQNIQLYRAISQTQPSVICSYFSIWPTFKTDKPNSTQTRYHFHRPISWFQFFYSITEVKSEELYVYVSPILYVHMNHIVWSDYAICYMVCDRAFAFLICTVVVRPWPDTSC